MPSLKKWSILSQKKFANRSNKSLLMILIADTEAEQDNLATRVTLQWDLYKNHMTPY